MKPYLRLVPPHVIHPPTLRETFTLIIYNDLTAAWPWKPKRHFCRAKLMADELATIVEERNRQKVG
jgi:hypothetical protein